MKYKNVLIGYVYIMKYDSTCFKVGVSSYPYIRVLQIKNATKKNVNIFYKQKVILPYLIEKITHFFLNPISFELNCNRCDGYTEWFKDIFSIASILAMFIIISMFFIEFISIVLAALLITQIFTYG